MSSPDLSKHPKKTAMCPHCDEKFALKYRLSFIKKFRPEDNYNPRDDDHLIPESLAKYASSYQNHGRIYVKDDHCLYDRSFVACDNCIKEEDKHHFHHFSKGWEIPEILKRHGPYDDSILKV